MVAILKTLDRTEQGIYIFWSNLKPNKMYIGSSINIFKRCNIHLSKLRNNNHYNKKLQNHVNKYGINDLQLCLHIIDNNLTLPELRNLEYNEIKFFDSVNNGFNLIYDEHFIGSYPKTIESRLKIAKSLRESKSNKVINIVKDSKILDTGTIRFISDKYKLDNSSIYKILAGKRFQHKGYTFK